MAASMRRYLSRGLIAALLLIPVWKLAGSFWCPGPSAVSAEAARLGRVLFTHRWSENDPLAQGDGLGPVFNASSCVECHGQGGVGGSGPVGQNVTVYSLAQPHPKGLPRSGVVHRKAVKPSFQETLKLVHPNLPSEPSIPLARGRSILVPAALGDRPVVPRAVTRRAAGVSISQRNTPALFGAGLIDAIPDEAIIAHQRKHSTAARLVGLNGIGDAQVKGRVARLGDGRIGRFGWKLEFAALTDFVKAACANELGLSNPGRPQPAPLGHADYQAKGLDLTESQCSLMADFIRSLPQPIEIVPDDAALGAGAKAGQALFRSIGCADCHAESLGPVQGLYSDLLLHDMGGELESSSGYGGGSPAPPSSKEQPAEDSLPSPFEWRTAPLWGVASSAPYLHDGRAPTLPEAIEAHGGEASGVTARFRSLAPQDQRAILVFLSTLRAPVVDPTPTDPHLLAASTVFRGW